MSRQTINLVADRVTTGSVLNALANAGVSVFVQNSDGSQGTQASVYQGTTGSNTLSQPFTTDNQGRIPGYLEPGNYIIEITYPNAQTFAATYCAGGPQGPMGPPGVNATVRGTWNSGTTYTAGPPPDAVVGSDNNWYFSLQSSNLNHDPTADFSHVWWAPFSGNDANALQKNANLSDLPNPAAARANLGVSAGNAVYLSPSGDTTGATDDTNFLNAIAGLPNGGTIFLDSGATPFYTKKGWAPPANATAGTITATVAPGSILVSSLAAGTGSVPAVGNTVYVFGANITAGTTLTVTGTGTTGVLSNAVPGSGGTITLILGSTNPTVGGPVCLQGVGNPILRPVGQATGIWYHRTVDYGISENGVETDNPPAGFIRDITLDGTNSTTASKHNYIKNPSFEYDTDQGTPADWGGSITTGTATLNTWQAQSANDVGNIGGWAAGGSQMAARLTVTVSSGGGYVKQTATGTGGIAVTAGQTYQVQAVVNMLTLATGANAVLNVKWWNSSGTALSTTTVSSTATIGVSQLAGTVAAPTNAAFASIQIGYSTATGSGTDDGFFDQIMFSQGATVLPYNDGDSPSWSWSGTAGNSASSGTTGGFAVDIGDGDGFDIDITVKNFTAQGSLGIYLANEFGYTARSKFRFRGYRNDTQVYIDGGGGGTNVFQDCEITALLRATTDQNGVVLSSAQVIDSQLSIRGLLPNSSATSGTVPTGNAAMLTLTGAATIFRSEIQAKVQIDAGGTGSVPPYTIYSDGSGAIQQCSGAIITDLGGAFMQGAECSFSGPWNWNDNLTWPSTTLPASAARWYNSGPDAIVTVTGGTVSAIGVNLIGTSLTSGSFFVSAGGDIKVTYSVAPTFTVLPARMIAEGAAPPPGGGGGGGAGNATLVGATVYPGVTGSGYGGGTGAVDWTNAGGYDTQIFTGSSYPTSTLVARQLQKVFLSTGELPSNVTSGSYNGGSLSAWNTFVNTHGGKLLVSLRPHSLAQGGYQDSAFAATIAALYAAYGTNWKCVLYSEPNTAKSASIFPGPTAGVSYGPAYVTYARHYAPLVWTNTGGTSTRKGNVPIVFDPAVETGKGDGEGTSFFPGYAYVDEISADYYATAWHGNALLGPLEKLANNAPGGPIPFSLSEIGWAASSSLPVWSPSLWAAYIDYLLNGGSHTYTYNGSTHTTPGDSFTGFAKRRTGTNKFPNGWMLFWSGVNGFPGPRNGNDWPGVGGLLNNDNPDPKLPSMMTLYTALGV